MQYKVLNYLIIIEPDTQTGTDKAGYSVYCLLLGLADGGDTIEEAILNMEKLIAFHLECLREEKKDILEFAILRQVKLTQQELKALL